MCVMCSCKEQRVWRVVCRDLGAGDLGGCTKEVLGKRVGAVVPAVRCQPN